MLKLVTLTETPVQEALSQLTLGPYASYQLMETLSDLRLGRIAFILLSTDGDPLPQTTACLAPHLVASATAFHV